MVKKRPSHLHAACITRSARTASTPACQMFSASCANDPKVCSVYFKFEEKSSVCASEGGREDRRMETQRPFLKHRDLFFETQRHRDTEIGSERNPWWNFKRHRKAPLRDLCASVFPTSARFLKHRDTETQRLDRKETWGGILKDTGRFPSVFSVPLCFQRPRFL
jgi:hypothetical protein